MIRREYPSPNLHPSRGNAGMRSTISCFSQATTITDPWVHHNNARVALSRTRRCLFWEQGWLRMDNISWQGNKKKSIYIYLAYVTNRAVGYPSTKKRTTHFHHHITLHRSSPTALSTLSRSYDSPRIGVSETLQTPHLCTNNILGCLLFAISFDHCTNNPLVFERLSATYSSL